LLPAVDRQFRGGLPRTFIGHSSGGILATYAAATRGTYGAVVALDTPINLGENWLAKKLAERAKASPTPLRYVSMETRFGWPEDAWKTLVGTAPASWKDRVTRWHSLKITQSGMTWSFMNGMRPRGVILFEGKLEGDTLSGKSRFGGIDFRRPDASPPPSPSFSFNRVRKC
jgi:pimeloyl-ACP methyl ester carboxylesterase